MNGPQNNRVAPNVFCPKCNTAAPAGTDVCPKCGARMPVKVGYMSDSQMARIRKPLNFVCWGLLIVIIIVKYFL